MKRKFTSKSAFFNLRVLLGLVLLRSVVAVFGFAVLSGIQADAQVNVTQEHNNPSRDGVYIDSAFTPSAAANLTRDLNFDGTISGNVYAQPLYVEGGPNGPIIIAVTESNNIYALNAMTGAVIWQRNVGTRCSLPDFRAETSILLASPARPWSISPHEHFSLTQRSTARPRSISSIR